MSSGTEMWAQECWSRHGTGMGSRRIQFNDPGLRSDCLGLEEGQDLVGISRGTEMCAPGYLSRACASTGPSRVQ